jgi:branched-chain amino acid transport system ATP-binding protein
MLLEAKDLHIYYGDIHAVSGVNFCVRERELVSIIGSNGAGKSSILNAVMGIVPIRTGSIRFDGKDITSLAPHHRAKAGIRMVPERARVFPRLTVYENLIIGVYGIRRRVDVDDQVAWLHELFPILKNRNTQRANTLSGGEQQQLAIARALISNPKLLLVDEVSMGLMPILVDLVFDVLKRLNREKGLTILLVEQNAMASLQISDRGYVLETGTCSYEGEGLTLLNDSRVKQAYLGN